MELPPSLESNGVYLLYSSASTPIVLYIVTRKLFNMFPKCRPEEAGVSFPPAFFLPFFILAYGLLEASGNIRSPDPRRCAAFLPDPCTGEGLRPDRLQDPDPLPDRLPDPSGAP